MIYDTKVKYNGKYYEAGVDVPVEDEAPAEGETPKEPEGAKKGK